MATVVTLTIHHQDAPFCHGGLMRTTRAKVPDQPVNVRLPKELHEAVLTRAAKDDRTMAQTIRVALRYYLQHTAPIAEA
jgi:hypothetical protein